MKKSAAAVLNVQLSLLAKKRKETVKNGLLISYIQGINGVLDVYAMDDIIFEAYRSIVGFNKSIGTSRLEFAEALTMKRLRCLQVYSKYVLKGTFVKDVLFTI